MCNAQVRVFESVNFKEFVKLLSAFSSRATTNTKLEYMFMIYDVDGDGERIDSRRDDFQGHLCSRHQRRLSPLRLPPSLVTGLISHEDLQIMLRQLAGSSLGEEQRVALVDMVLQRAKCPQGLDLKAFKAALASADLSHMKVEVPIEN